MLSLSIPEAVYVLDRKGIEALVEILLSLSSITISAMKTIQNFSTFFLRYYMKK